MLFLNPRSSSPKHGQLNSDLDSGWPSQVVTHNSCLVRTRTVIWKHYLQCFFLDEVILIACLLYMTRPTSLLNNPCGKEMLVEPAGVQYAMSFGSIALANVVLKLCNVSPPVKVFYSSSPCKYGWKIFDSSDVPAYKANQVMTFHT